MENSEKYNKTLIAMSGGVDSSVAALLIKEKSVECVGATMVLKGDGISVDVEDANNIASKLGIPFHVFDLKTEFNREVIDRFTKAYKEGLTPNPCIYCNKHIKYHSLTEKANALGCEYVATGHYAKIEKDESTGKYLLKMAEDKSKDQSYFLYMLNQEQLSKTLFPLGSMPKTEVRNIAESNGFENARKHDSQDICFVENGKYVEFIEDYTKETYPEGNFVDTSGAVIGRHLGIIRYTIGQRKGLGQSFGEPMYVVDILPEKNEVVLGRNEDLFKEKFVINEINMIYLDNILEPMRLSAKVRYNQNPKLATAVQTGSDEITVTFDEPQRAITKGQAAVLYDNETVVAGGIICRVE